MSEPENPHAFPMGSPEQCGYDGMSLRDYFAGRALEAILLAAGIQAVQRREEFRAEPICVDAYKFADAMLAERERSNA